MISAHYRSVRQKLLTHPRVWLVTGAAGFIGSNLVEDLLSLGQTVIGLDNFSTGYRANLDEALAAGKAHFRMIEGDIRDLDTCRAACEGVDYVLHHAALGSVPWSMDDPLRTNSVNVDGFVNMLVAAREAGVKRVVYASSSAVYGDTAENPQTEPNTGRPLSPYAASKMANEIYASAFQMSYGLQAIGLRYYNVFGPRQDPSGAYAAVIPRWISKLLSAEPCVIFGDGETTRDFVYVANVVEANLLAATAPDQRATGQVYNVACAESISLNQLFNTIRSLLVTDQPEFARVSPHYQPFREGDIRYSSAAIEKARELLCYVPTHTVTEGLGEALGWYVTRSRGADSDRHPATVEHLRPRRPALPAAEQEISLVAS